MQLVDRYFAHMRAHDLDGLAALFGEDAVATLPDGQEAAGVPAIRDMYRRIFAAAAPTPALVLTVCDGASAAAEVRNTLADGSVRHTATFFHLGPGGRIARLNIYKRGGW